MFAAYKDIRTKEKISVNEAEKGREYFCPGCKKRVYVVTPKHKKAFFRHYNNESCFDYWKYDESDWSNRIKSRFNINDVETVVEINREIHRFDINIKNKLAIMLQSGTMYASTFREKTNCILSTGMKVLWLFNYEEAYEAGKIKRKPYGNNMTWNNPSKTFEEFQDNPRVYIVFEIMDDEEQNNSACFAVLERVEDLYASKTIYVKRWLSRDQFIQYYNDIADGKDPEEPYLLIEEQRKKEEEAKLAAQMKIAEERRRQREIEDENRRKREEEQRIIELERQRVLRENQEREREIAEAKRRAEDQARLVKLLEKEKEQQANLEKEEEMQLLECKYTIVELWNEYNPKRFLTVGNKKGEVYRIERNPQDQLSLYGQVYGIPKGKRTGAPNEAILDANEPIWKKNHVM